MKNYSFNLIFGILIVLSILFGTFIWEKIIIPFNDNMIVGEYLDKKFNPANDILRYLAFIFLPIIIFFSQVFFRKQNFKNLILNLNNFSNIQLKKNTSLFFIFFILTLLIIFEFLSAQFQLHNLDLMHEGQQLSSAFKSSKDGSLWSGSYVTQGIFYETISAKILWYIFDTQTIGLKRITDIFLIFSLKFLLIVLSLRITKFLKVEEFYKNIFFILNSLIFLSVIDYNIASVDHLVAREIPIIFSLILFSFFFENKKLNTPILLIFGFLSIATLLWGIDRGLVMNLILISFLILLLIRKDLKNFIILLSSIFIWWLLFYFYLGSEFKHFIVNTFSIYKYVSYVHGIIHPTPFSDHPDSSRATKTLLSIIFISIFTINLFLKVNDKYYLNFKFLLMFLCFSSIFSYAYVVGRSDGPHIKHIFGFPIIFFSVIFLYFILFNINKKIKIDTSSAKNIFLIFFLLILFPIIFDINLKNLKNYNFRFEKYINLPDQKFLNQKEINFINESKSILQDKKCIQLFSHDAALHYLLKKKSCTKYYLIWSVGSIPDQKNFINELNNTEIIISGGVKFNWLAPLEERLFLVNAYIEENFEKIETIEDWTLLKRKKN